MPSTLDFLEREGFICMEHSRFKNNTAFVELTEREKAVAIHLQDGELTIAQPDSPETHKKIQ